MTQSLVERLRELLSKATGTGSHGFPDMERPLPWEVWTSCSYRRVKTAGVHGGKDVLSGYAQRSDGQIDLSMPEERLVALVDAVNLIPTLLERLAVAEEALEPFARAAEQMGEGPDDAEFVDGDDLLDDVCLQVGHLRRARTALSMLKEKGDV